MVKLHLRQWWDQIKVADSDCNSAQNDPVFSKCEITYIPMFLGGVMKACGNIAPINIKSELLPLVLPSSLAQCHVSCYLSTIKAAAETYHR